MKIGTHVYGQDPETIARVARTAEEIGYESLWISDHVVLPADIPKRYPYSPDGVVPLTTGYPMLDAFSVLNFVAAHTSRIMLGTQVYILPLRNPFVTARVVMSLDRLSVGRALLGVGIGWLDEEFKIMGLGQEFSSRAARSDEAIQLIRQLWSEPEIEFRGTFYSSDPFSFEPKPVQQPGPPILVGGESAAALKRAARLGDGWIGVGHSVDSARERVAKLRDLRTQYGRAGEPFDVSVGADPRELTPAVIQQYEDAGVTRILVNFGGVMGGVFPGAGDPIESMERFGSSVVAKVT